MEKEQKDEEQKEDEEKEEKEDGEKEQSAVCHPLNSWDLQQRHDFEQSGFQASN